MWHATLLVHAKPNVAQFRHLIDINAVMRTVNPAVLTLSSAIARDELQSMGAYNIFASLIVSASGRLSVSNLSARTHLYSLV